LAERVNVVIVGGDLAHPSPDEQSTLERIRRAAVGTEKGVVTLAGHMASADVHDMMAYAASHGGVYVCASDKEEFGLAIVEALAAGAVVVAPERGGPRTYVEDGTTGVLCDTMSVSSLRDAIVDALVLVSVPGRAQRAAEMVRRELTVERMAERLGQVYRELVPATVAAK
jgi:glycosyltransferase involved in cell wall biosynthesis